MQFWAIIGDPLSHYRNKRKLDPTRSQEGVSPELFQRDGHVVRQNGQLAGPRARSTGQTGFSPRTSTVSPGPSPAAPGSPSARQPGRLRLRPYGGFPLRRRNHNQPGCRSFLSASLGQAAGATDSRYDTAEGQGLCCGRCHAGACSERAFKALPASRHPPS